MKKKSLLLIVICLLLTAMPIAKADVIFEPPDDFYEQHREECTYLNRVYYANAEGGFAPIYTSPDNLRAEEYIENGAELYISFTYRKGDDVFGLIQYKRNANGKIENAYDGTAPTAWLRLSDMLLKYDSLQFLLDYGTDIKPFSGTFDGAGASKMVLWSWPGSGEVISVEDMTKLTGGGSWGIEDSYTDSEEREWGHIGYYYGRRSIWICMSDPENENIPATVTQTLSFKTPSPEGENVLSRNTDAGAGEFPVLPVLLVVGVVIITAFLIFRVSKKQGR